MNALQAVDCCLPVIMFSKDPAIRQYLSVNGMRNAQIVDSSLSSPALETSLNAALSVSTKPPIDKQPFIVGNHPRLIEIKKLLMDLGRYRENILIQGEKGVGKELLARAIHWHTDQRGIFIRIDSPALAAAGKGVRLIDYLKPVLWDTAEGDSKRLSLPGTLYVHEIGEMPTNMQAELLLVVDKSQMSFSAGGSEHPRTLRLIAGSSKDLDQLVKAHAFREDIYYRSSTLGFNLPPLRERKDDIPLLTDYFTYKYCKEFGKSFFELSPSTQKMFFNYHWPGNIQELTDVVRRAVLLNQEKGLLTNYPEGSLGHNYQERRIWMDGLASIQDIVEGKDYLKNAHKKPLKAICWDIMARVEKRIIRKALKNTNWNRKKAAAMLNISYKSMLNKIKEYKLA
jgi:DNA-binding NtrC family response regulator